MDKNSRDLISPEQNYDSDLSERQIYNKSRDGLLSQKMVELRLAHSYIPEKMFPTSKSNSSFEKLPNLTGKDSRKKNAPMLDSSANDNNASSKLPLSRRSSDFERSQAAKLTATRSSGRHRETRVGRRRWPSASRPSAEQPAA